MDVESRGGSLRILAVAALHWTAGYDHLLLGLRDLLEAGRDATLRVEATGPARERFLFTVHDLGLAPVVTLAAPDRAEVVGRADVLVLAAVVDQPWPEMLTARHRAGSVVATDLPWAREHLGPDTAATELVPVRSGPALAAALARVGLPPGDTAVGPA
jgi:hypothetical protein